MVATLLTSYPSGVSLRISGKGETAYGIPLIMLVRQMTTIVPLHFHSAMCRLGLLTVYTSVGVSSGMLSDSPQPDSGRS